MKKSLVHLALVFAFLLGFGRVHAGEVTPQATSSSVVEQSQDITAPRVREERMTKLLKATNENSILFESPLRKYMAKAVDRGVSVNTLVLLLLFPLVASLVAFSRQVVGLNGFGMITPSLLAVAFLSTGGLVGTMMLVIVVGLAILFKASIKKLKIPYLPKLAILLWMVLLGVLGLMLSGGEGVWSHLLKVGIFPIILFVSVAETFIEAQITRNFNSSLVMLLETVILAMVGYKIMSSHLFQTLALVNPEIWLLFVLLINFLIARYKGLRLMEVWRFRKIILR